MKPSFIKLIILSVYVLIPEFGKGNPSVQVNSNGPFNNGPLSSAVEGLVLGGTLNGKPGYTNSNLVLILDNYITERRKSSFNGFFPPGHHERTAEAETLLANTNSSDARHLNALKNLLLAEYRIRQAVSQIPTTSDNDEEAKILAKAKEEYSSAHSFLRGHIVAMINNLADAHTPSSLQRAANTYNYVVQTSENSNNQNVFSTDLYQGVTFGDLLNLVRPNRGTFPTSSDKNLGLSQFRPLSTDETQSGSKSLIKSAATHNEHIES